MLLRPLPSAAQPFPSLPQGALGNRGTWPSPSGRGQRQYGLARSNCVVADKGSRVLVASTEPVVQAPLADGELVLSDPDDVVPESGILCDEALRNLDEYRRVEAYSATVSSSSIHNSNGFAYSPAQRNQIRESWDALMRWSKVFRTRKLAGSPLEAAKKIVVFGGGSFGTAMGCALARQKSDLDVVLLVRDPYLCKDINTLHENTRYLKGFQMPHNVRATTLAAEAIAGAQYAVHAVPVQSSRAFLQGIKDYLPPSVPIICVSKGLEVGSGQMMSELIPSALERKQPAVFLSGPSFAREVMQNRPTGVVAACKDGKLAKTVQDLFASPTMRVNMTTDVVGVEICGALKNVLAIAAGIVEGMDLGHNALAALVAQGCSEIRWLSEKMGAKPTTMSGLSGLGDIMLTCYGDLSRNRSVGIRLGRGERLEDIIASSSQVAEGVATAGVVVGLARKYRVSLPVLTAVAQVLDNNLTAREAVFHIMNLPQIEEA
ncbi:hypothetical protein VOLCADRAFT_88544 [Volvox carteri f. nagariensis]|uniref:Glycerol-3-phosphate dehydrogenase [NAD(+)] n=1 Tax=Volvox carteri f. nagariensis TaxID=3068 RepID=D8TPA3_VOLCA|nr:uncharacterized protein VOLCADRAFT_88544 [Volvox carteri f. nagariensis]EFJ50587.1 hypothetical protein VOLCADRAFT_88544 [Volvox carteri f. nagariensis]|eukprot:XP_002948180.1 hypothetical protein VOLCADRAFT_88544 [Volvox carteri f. nagariensis]